ncbi:hypothetical protein [Virgibacillus kimchii]
MDERKSMEEKDKEIFLIALGRIIRKNRKFKGETIEEVAWKIGTDAKHLNKIELGHREAGSYKQFLLQKELQFPSEEYMKEYEQLKAEWEEED